MLSIITTTYSHADTIARTILSVLGQTYQDWEMVIVNDGCRYDLAAVLRNFPDSRIRVITHPVNRGPNAARNTALDNIRGDWFTMLDDDDELCGADALARLASVPARVDPSITAVTCNCIDGATGELTGFGLDRDQYLDWVTVMTRCSGEFWGITRTSLLQGERFNPDVRGYENVFWHRIDKRARRYYIHHACRIWHTEAEQRISNEKVNDAGAMQRIYQSFRAIVNETEYLEDLSQYSPETYMATLFSAGLSFIRNNDRAHSLQVFKRLVRGRSHFLWKGTVLAGTVIGQPFLAAADTLKELVRPRRL